LEQRFLAMNTEQVWTLLIVLTLLFFEFFFPLRSYLIWSKHKVEDLLWVIVHEVVYVFLLFTTLFKINNAINAYLIKHKFILKLQAQHVIVQGIVLFLVLDFVSYWLHRSFHSFKPMWSMHRLHHSTTELTVLSAFRQSLGEAILSGLIFGFFSGFVLVSNQVFSFVSVFFMSACFIQHSNIKFRIPSFANKIFITPRNHLWHHSIEMIHSKGQNFGFVLVWWDYLFGTHYNPNSTNTKIGFSDDFKYTNFFGKIIFPMDNWIMNFLKNFKRN
jgi:sterol desaturase/sphingolipid hydroxylase (fatty acid hydroxylase superfamily)